MGSPRVPCGPRGSARRPSTQTNRQTFNRSQVGPARKDACPTHLHMRVSRPTLVVVGCPRTHAHPHRTPRPSPCGSAGSPLSPQVASPPGLATTPPMDSPSGDTRENKAGTPSTPKSSGYQAALRHLASLLQVAPLVPGGHHWSLPQARHHHLYRPLQNQPTPHLPILTQGHCGGKP